MPNKPDTEKGGLVHAVLKFLGSHTGLVLVCVILTVTGIVKWRDIVDLLHGREQVANATDKGKADPATQPGSNPGGNPGTNPGANNGTPGVTPSVTPPKGPPPNAAPTITVPDALTFSSGERTKQLEVTIDDEDAAQVKVSATVAAGLVLANGAKVTGKGRTRFLEVSIDPDKWGSAVVRLTATDAAGLASESLVKVTVHAPALSIVKIPDVAVACGEKIAIITVAVEDLARKPGKVTITPLPPNPLFAVDGVKFNPDSMKLQLVPKSRMIGSATVTLVAQSDDGREARTSFKVTVNPLPLEAGRKATVVISLASGGLHMDVKGLNSVLGSPALNKGTIVQVKDVQGKRCQIEWTAGGDTHTGWVDADILTPDPCPE